MRYNKFKVYDEIGVADLLVHAVRAYDLAGTIAAYHEDFDRLLVVGDKIKDASDLLFAMSVAEQGLEERMIEENGSTNGEFGFTVPKPPTEGDSECGTKGK